MQKRGKIKLKRLEFNLKTDFIKQPHKPHDHFRISFGASTHILHILISVVSFTTSVVLLQQYTTKHNYKL